MGLFDLFSSDNESAARDARTTGYNNAFTQTSQALNKGLGDLRADYGAADQYYQGLAPMLAQGMQGYGAYGDATGAGGAEGLARAQDLFKQSGYFGPGYDMGLEAIDRRAASRGMLGSGNTNIDTAKYASDYGAQKYGQYVAGLQPYMNVPGQQFGVAQARAGLQTGMGDKAWGTGALLGDYGWKQQTGIGDANAAFELSKDQTGMNQLGGILGLGKLGGKLFGMF